jgi:xanthine phosphoribosyltransferase
MKLLKERILRDGRVMAGEVLKVDSFLNHQMDIGLFSEIAREFYLRFKNCGVNKILTIEASGIGIACVTAQFFDVPVVFAKKNPTKNIAGEVIRVGVESYTQGRTYDIMVSKQFLGPSDRLLIIDDFLARGCALKGLVELARAAGAHIVGAGIVIEKGFQEGGALIRAMGVRVESLAVVASMSEEGGVVFSN